MEKKHISLFSGIGGFDYAAEMVGWINVAHCEWNNFGKRVLNYYWPNAKSYGDITKTDFTIFRGNTDILTGGFPCQGFSLAGKRLGTDDARYLWPEMLRVIKETKPTFIVGENVTGIISMEDKSGNGRDVFFEVEGRTIIRTLEIDKYDAIYSRQAKMLIVSICQDLEKEGYEVQPILIPAASVQAPHRRDRVWFIASKTNAPHSHCSIRCCLSRHEARHRRKNKKNTIYSDNDGDGSPSNSARIGFGRQSNGIRETRFFNEKGKADDWSNFPTQSPICIGNDGLSSKLDGITFSKWRNESIKAAGNAIVPQVAIEIFKSINEFFKSNEKL